MPLTFELMTASSPLVSLDSELGCILRTSLATCLARFESPTGRLFIFLFYLFLYYYFATQNNNKENRKGNK